MPPRNRTLDLPVAVNESISLDLDPLPPAEDVQVFLEALAYERPASKYWTRLSSQLFIEGRIDEAVQVASKGVQVLESYKPAETIPLRAFLAAVSLNSARTAPKLILNDARYQRLGSQQTKDDLYRRSNQAQSPANALDPKHHINQLSRAIFLTTTGQNEGALVVFDAILNANPRHALALLGKACILLRKRQYAPALKLYQNALEVSLLVQANANENADILGWRGPDPRVGIGLCLWGLGHHDAARKAWKRAVHVNANNAAAHLLLGISSLNLAKQTARLVPGTFGAHVDRSEEEARELAYTEGMQSLQQSWKLDKKNATAAVAMCEYFINRAAQAESQPGSTIEVEQAAMAHYATALKLGEHAIQYAEARVGVNHAQLIYARAAHLASQLTINATQPELRLQAQRYYQRVVEDVTRALSSATAASAPNSAQLNLFLSLASLGLAQCQVANRDPLAAINTLDVLSTRPASSVSATQTVELSLLAASLRAQSHPGATAAERRDDAERARIMLDRTLRLIEAAKLDAFGPQALFTQPDELPDATKTSVATADAATDVPPALAKASLAIRTEDLSKSALEAIASLGADPLTRVEFAELLQTEDLARATSAYAEALELARAKAGANADDGKIHDDESANNVALLASLETCLGAVLAMRATDIPAADPQRDEERSWLLQRAIARLESAVTAAADAVTAFGATAASATTTAKLEAQRTVDAVKLIASYNLGRANEEADNLDVARQAYNALLGAHPEYIDAKVRLAILSVAHVPTDAVGAEAAAKMKARRDAANALLKEALDSDPGNLDTRATYICFLAGEFAASPTPAWAAIKEFTARLFASANDKAAHAAFGGAAAAKAATEAGRRDAHTLASLGWTYYQLAIHASGPTAKAERSKNMTRATDLMDKALAEDARCAFAAQGMAILLAEDAFAEMAGGTSVTLPGVLGGAPEERRKKNADEAFAILGKLREVRDEPSVHVCMGHVLMQKEEYERAHKSYELAARRSVGAAKAAVVQYVARAEYAIGMKTKSFASLQSSLAHLEEARALLMHERGEGHPECRQIEYNYAVTAHKGLQMLFDLQKDRKTAQALRDAMVAVQRVQPLLVAPADASSPQQTPLGKEGALLEAARRGQLLWMTPEIVEQRGKYGASSLVQRATAALADQESYEAEVQKHKEAVALARREKELAREQERMRKEEEYRAQVEQMAEKRKALREEAAKIEYLREATPEKEPRRRAKRDDVTSGEEDAPDATADKGRKRKRAAGKKKKKAAKKSAESSESGLSDDDALFGGAASGSESSDNNDDEDGDDEIIRNGAKLLAEEGGEAGGTRSGKSSKLSKLAKSKKKGTRKSTGESGKKRRKSLKRAKARDTDDEDDNDAGSGEESVSKSRKAVFDESSDDDGEPSAKKAATQKRTKKARVTNDMIDSDEEMALLDME